MSVPKVYEAITRVQAVLAKEGIAKDRKNPQGYYFRGIDDVYKAVCGLMAEHRLCVIPRVVSKDREERSSKSGTGVLIYTVLTVEFDFVSAEDGSKHTAVMVGEAMDSGDKSANKAMSAAYKYALLQVFAIPTEGDNDTENHTHEVAPKSKPVDKPPKAADRQPMTPAPVDCGEYAKVRDILKAAGCKTTEDAAALVRFVTPSETLAGIKVSTEKCRFFLDCYSVAKLDYTNDASVLQAAIKSDVPL